jgi:hypothetical protein
MKRVVYSVMAFRLSDFFCSEYHPFSCMRFLVRGGVEGCAGYIDLQTFRKHWDTYTHFERFDANMK